MNDETDLTRLIDALRDARLTIPDEVRNIPHLIIAVKANAPRGGRFDDDDDDFHDEMLSDTPAMNMSDGRGLRRRGRKRPGGLNDVVLKQAALAKRLSVPRS